MTNFSNGEVLNGYIAFYNGRKHELYAASALAAKEIATAYFKPPKSQRHMVTVVLAEKDGKTVTHSTAGL